MLCVDKGMRVLGGTDATHAPPPTHPTNNQVQILPAEGSGGGGFVYQYRAKYEIKNRAQLLGWLERYNQVCGLGFVVVGVGWGWGGEVGAAWCWCRVGVGLVWDWWGVGGVGIAWCWCGVGWW